MLLIEEGKDYEDVDETKLPYTLLKNLWHGHSGTVEKVRDKMTKAVFARKIIYTPHSRLRKQERIKVFHNEVKIIRALGCHRHIVSVFATYITQRHFGLILQPVASDGDSEDFLVEYWSLISDMKDRRVCNTRVEQMIPIMERAFGCLTVGLAFMHKRKSTTEGRPAFFTRKYSAPEVLEHEKRNSRSDIFSLGCVFIDLLLALTVIPGTEHEVKNYSESMDDIHELFKSFYISPRYSSLPNIIRGMTMRDDSLRLCGLHVAGKLLALPYFSCLDCRSTPIKAWTEGYNQDFSISEKDSTQTGQCLTPKRCCIEGYHRELAPENSHEAKEPERYETLTSNKREHSSSIPHDFPPFLAPIVEVSELRYCIPFTIDKKGSIRDNQGRLQGCLRGGIDSLHLLGYKTHPNCGIYDISGHLIGRYQPNKIEQLPDDTAPIKSENRGDERRDSNAAIRDINPKHELRSSSSKPGSFHINPSPQQALLIQPVHISPFNHVSPQTIYHQAPSPPPSTITYSPHMEMHRYESKAQTPASQVPQVNGILSFEEMRSLGHKQAHNVSSPFSLPDLPFQSIVSVPSNTFNVPTSPIYNLAFTQLEIIRRIALNHNITLPKLPFPNLTDWESIGPRGSANRIVEYHEFFFSLFTRFNSQLEEAQRGNEGPQQEAWQRAEYENLLAMLLGQLMPQMEEVQRRIVTKESRDLERDEEWYLKRCSRFFDLLKWQMEENQRRKVQLGSNPVYSYPLIQ